MILALSVVGVLFSVALHANEKSPTPEQLEFFEKQVRPLLAKHCYECHSVNSKRVEAKLLLDQSAGTSQRWRLGGGDPSGRFKWKPVNRSSSL